MAKIIKSTVTDEKTLFRMMNGKCEKLKESKGEVVDICGYALIEQMNANETEEVTILYLVFWDGRVCATNSPTVRRTFDAMVTAFGEPTVEHMLEGVKIVESTSRNGRAYLDLDFAD